MGLQSGFSELVIDFEQLNIGRFMVRSCNGVMPDSTPFRSHSAIVREVSQVKAGSLIYLALPAERLGKVDTGSQDSQFPEAFRHLSFDHDILDSSDRESDPVTLTLSRLNLKLLLENEEPDTHIRLPLARIIERQNDGKIILDSTFIPRCLDYRVSPYLKEQVQNLQARMRSHAAVMANQIGPRSPPKECSDPAAGIYVAASHEPALIATGRYSYRRKTPTSRSLP